MKLLLLIIAVVLSFDTFIEVQLLCKAQNSIVEVMLDEQEEQGEQTELPSLTIIDKTTSHPHYQFYVFPAYALHKYKTPDNLHPVNLVHTLYQPPDA